MSNLPSFNPIKSKIDVDKDILFLSNLEYINVINLKVFNEIGHSIPIFITYDINTPSLINTRNVSLPDNFRLSVNQFVYYEDGLFKYVDSYGITHTFTNFDTNL